LVWLLVWRIIGNYSTLTPVVLASKVLRRVQHLFHF